MGCVGDQDWIGLSGGGFNFGLHVEDCVGLGSKLSAFSAQLECLIGNLGFWLA